MKRIFSIVMAFAAPLAVMAQVTVFSDNFSGGSTIQSAAPGAGSASAADYEVFTSTAAPTGYSLNPNDLSFTSAGGSSVLAEVMARFGGGPVTLANIGDYINLTITFVDTANVLITGNNASSTLNVGLYNSGGVNLNQGAQLNAGALSGGSQTYLGYVGRLFLNGNASSYNRNTQAVNGTTSQNQDLLFNNASSTAAFNSPLGTTTTGTFGVNGNQAGLVGLQTYTLSYTLTLTAANAIRYTNQLFNGSSAIGTPILNNGGTSTSGAFLTSTFDAFALGFRTGSGTTGTGTLDISQITITTIPEPSVLALSGFGILALGTLRRWKR